MLQIKPVSDLRNKFTDIEKIVKTGQPVFLTKNGYGSMVVLSIESYSRLTDSVEAALSEADAAVLADPTRLSHEEVFSGLRGRINGR